METKSWILFFVASTGCVTSSANLADSGVDTRADVPDLRADVPEVRDIGPDRMDAELPPCEFGWCTDVCLSLEVCIDETRRVEGSESDPILDAPEGLTSIERVRFSQGLCVPIEPQPVGSPGACVVGSHCVGCGQCADVEGIAVCLDHCRPGRGGNGGCRRGYVCDRMLNLCMPTGCQTDDECRVQRVESNGVPGIQTPESCAADPLVCDGQGFDALRYDGSARCNLDTYECEGTPHNPDAIAGDACSFDTDCEEGGRCQVSTSQCSNDALVDCEQDSDCTAALTSSAVDGDCVVDFPGGQCTKDGCHVEGNECAGAGVCRMVTHATSMCQGPCTVGLGAAVSEVATWVDPVLGAGGCRDGYRCSYDHVGAFGEVNGGCVPASFSADPVANIGEPCSASSDCVGPFGAQFCAPRNDGRGYCSLSDCAAPYFDPPIDVCGEGNRCFVANQGFRTDSVCLQDCDSAEDCAPGMACARASDHDPEAEGRVCLTVCIRDDDCRDGDSCVRGFCE